VHLVGFFYKEINSVCFLKSNLIVYDDVNIIIASGIVWRQDKQLETGEKYVTMNFIIVLFA
jgi:hypothetical protein